MLERGCSNRANRLRGVFCTGHTHGHTGSGLGSWRHEKLARARAPARVKLSGGRLTADGRNRDMRHRRIRLGAMPVPLTCLDVHDIVDGYLTLFRVGCGHASAGCDHQGLVAAEKNQ